MSTVRGFVGGVLGLSVLGAVLTGQENAANPTKPTAIIDALSRIVVRFLDPTVPAFSRVVAPRRLVSSTSPSTTTPSAGPAGPPAPTPAPSSAPRVLPNGRIRDTPTTAAPAPPAPPSRLPNGRLRQA